jgi:GT2 family glycosyltransferase
MIAALRRLFGRGEHRATTATLNDRLELAVGRRPAGRVRASARIGRRRVSVVERSDEAPGEQPSPDSLHVLLEQLVPRLDARRRAQVFELVQSATLADVGRPGGAALAGSLLLLRNRLREPLPEPSGVPAAPQRLIVDHLFGVDDRAFWVFGWCRDDDGALAGAEIVSPEGQRARLLEGAYRFPRRDVEEQFAFSGIGTTTKHGFANLIELEHPSPLVDGWIAELRGTAVDFELPLPPAIRDPIAIRAHVLAEAANERPDIDILRRDHARPALDRLQAHTRRSISVDEVVQHGETPPSPDISVIVPLYGRTDLVEHQIAQFWNDPDLVASELIYVLDSPELGNQLTHEAALLHDLYGLPFKVIRLNRNGGYATANNLGVSHARGRLVLLLNSDVIPDRPGWLSRMRDFHDATPKIGAVGPKLLFEDESIQHAGMYFHFEHRTNLWENQHYFKGFSRTLEAAATSRAVPAVTGACLMVDRQLYEQVGGLHEGYVQGGYEDSDLCLRLIDAGKRNWYLADVELYHLEAQSLPIEVRHANRYNAWLQTHLWSDRIAQLMVAQPDLPQTEVAALD